jgi:hypothetical protein
VKKLEFVIHTPLKVTTRCTMLHLVFPGVLMAEGIARVSKDSRSSATHGLPLLCKKGKHMVTMTWVLRPNTLVMRYESKHLPSVTNLDDVCKDASA